MSLRPHIDARILDIVLTYAVVGTLWILFSDQAVSWLFEDPVKIMVANTLKGWLFIAITSMALFVVLSRRFSGQAALSAPARPLLPFVFATIAIVLATMMAISETVREARRTEAARLQTIADLKARQIGDWIAERRGDAGFLQSSAFLANLFHRWRDDNDPVAGDQLKTRLEQLRQFRRIDGISLIGTDDRLLWQSDSAASAPQAPELVMEIAAARGCSCIRMAGPYADTLGTRRLDFIAPLTLGEEINPVIILHLEAAAWLDTVLKSWPVPNQHGESILVRRLGTQVSILNASHQDRESRQLPSLPLNSRTMIASRMLRGERSAQGSLEGPNHRGQQVIAVGRAIPETDWFLIAAVSQSEHSQDLARAIARHVLTGIAALLAVGALVMLLRQRSRLVLAEVQHKAQAEKLEALQLLASLSDASDDAIFAKDLEGRYLVFNRAASGFVGKPPHEVIGNDDRAIFPPDQAEMLLERNREIIRGAVVFTHEEQLDTVLGSRTFLATKGPLRDGDGEIIGTFGISRDITERKHAEAELASSEARFRALVEQSLAGIYIIQDGVFRYVNPGLAAIFRYDRPEDIIDRVSITDLVSPDDRERVAENIHKGINGDSLDMRYGFTGHRRDGSVVELEIHGRAFEYQGKPSVIGVVLDVTARVEAERDLRRQAEELSRRNHELERFHRATVGRELDMISLKRQINALAAELGQPAPYDLGFLQDGTGRLPE